MKRFALAAFVSLLIASPASALIVSTGKLQTQQVTISSGSSLSPAIDLGDARLVGILIPAAWTTANLTYQVSPDCVTYGNVYDATGAEYITATTGGAGTYIILSPADFIGFRCLKIRSGTSGSAVNQGADRVLTLSKEPF